MLRQRLADYATATLLIRDGCWIRHTRERREADMLLYIRRALLASFSVSFRYAMSLIRHVI